MSEILLKAGTGELEIIEFMVDSKYYAINVLKVKGIVQIDNITPLPQMTGAVAGLTNIRGEMNTVIDLRQVLHKKSTADYTKSLGLLCEFNETIIVFLVDRVEGIKRIMWEDIKQTNQVQEDTLSIGSILDNEKIIIMLDFESITIASHIGQGYEVRSETLGEIVEKTQPIIVASILDNEKIIIMLDFESITIASHIGQGYEVRSETLGEIVEKTQPIIVAEDSKAIGEMVKCSLVEAGYRNVTLFHNGQEAKDYIFELKAKWGERFKEKASLLITDIEMPMLDGYTLTKSIKEDEVLKSLKVIIFSSLITAELRHKGETVGADLQISKPSMKGLIKVVDQLVEDGVI